MKRTCIKLNANTDEQNASSPAFRCPLKFNVVRMKTYVTTIGLVFFCHLLIAAGIGVGDVAPSFSLKNIDGKMVSPSDYPAAKGFIVIFTCNHCPYAVAYEQRIVELDKKFKAKGYPVIAINPNDPIVVPADSYDNMVLRAKEAGFTFPYLWDETQEIARKYGAERTPHVYILQKKDEKMVVKYIGAIDDNYKNAGEVTEKYLENAVKALLKGEEPVPSFTKAIGCNVKYRK